MDPTPATTAGDDLCSSKPRALTVSGRPSSPADSGAAPAGRVPLVGGDTRRYVSPADRTDPGGAGDADSVPADPTDQTANDGAEKAQNGAAETQGGAEGHWKAPSATLAYCREEDAEGVDSFGP